MGAFCHRSSASFTRFTSEHEEAAHSDLGGRQSEPSVGVSGPGSNYSIDMSETAKSFHMNWSLSLRTLRIFAFSASRLFQRRGRKDTQSTQRCVIIWFSQRLAAPRKRSHICFLLCRQAVSYTHLRAH